MEAANLSVLSGVRSCWCRQRDADICDEWPMTDGCIIHAAWSATRFQCDHVTLTVYQAHLIQFSFALCRPRLFIAWKHSDDRGAIIQLACNKQDRSVFVSILGCSITSAVSVCLSASKQLYRVDSEAREIWKYVQSRKYLALAVDDYDSE